MSRLSTWLLSFVLLLCVAPVLQAEDAAETQAATEPESQPAAEASSDSPSSTEATNGKKATKETDATDETDATAETDTTAETESNDADAADDENAGLDDLDQATQLKVTAQGLPDLNKVIDHLDSALDKGLDKDNTKFAEDLLVSSLMQRATMVSGLILDLPPENLRRSMRWMEIRQLAMTDLQRALELDDQLWGAYVLVGRLQSLPLGDPTTARHALTKVVDAPDVSAEQRAQALALRGAVQRDDKKRIGDFNRAVELAPEKAEYRRLRAQYYYSNDKLDDALADVDHAIKLEPDEAASHELRGLILLGLERYDDALASFDRTTELVPASVLPYQQRGELFRRQGDLDKAVQQLSKALEIAPDNVVTLLLRAGIYYQQHEPERALADVEQAIRVQPQVLQAHLMRAEIYAGTDRMDQAIAQLERLLRLAPGQKELLTQLGSFYLIDGQSRKAIDTLSQVLQQEPDDGPVLRLRGDAYLGIGKHAEAIADFDRALELDEENNALLNNLAWVLATSPVDELRDGKRAVRLATKAAELTGYQTPHILSTLAAAYAETGDYESAIKWSEKAVELGKDDPDLGQLQQELASYQAGKPVRELKKEEEKQAESPPSDQTSAPTGPPATQRTADF
jgi:tetratricopeptide (TPR) repeat protein